MKNYISEVSRIKLQEDKAVTVLKGFIARLEQGHDFKETRRQAGYSLKKGYFYYLPNIAYVAGVCLAFVQCPSNINLIDSVREWSVIEARVLCRTLGLRSVSDLTGREELLNCYYRIPAFKIALNAIDVVILSGDYRTYYLAGDRLVKNLELFLITNGRFKPFERACMRKMAEEADFLALCLLNSDFEELLSRLKGTADSMRQRLAIEEESLRRKSLAEWALNSGRLDILSEWHPTKNTITPDQVSPGSTASVWWLCERGHEKFTCIKNRVYRGTGCQICANQARVGIPAGVLNLADWAKTHSRSDLIDEWHPINDRTPADYSFGSNAKVLWRCQHGHEWLARIINRRNGQVGCPICLGRFATPEFNLAITHPEIAKEWCFVENEGMPESYLPGSGKKVWWLCRTCSYRWRSSILSRTRKSGGTACSACTGRIATPVRNLAIIRPDLATEWSTANAKPPEAYAPFSNKIVWWHCSSCRHEWRASVHQRSSSEPGTGCPGCLQRRRLKQVQRRRRKREASKR